MRIVSFILTLFVFALAVMPCTDTMMPDKEHHEEELASGLDETSHDHRHGHGDDEDDCPPFCACQCCGIHVLGPANIPFLLEEVTVNDTYTDYYTFNYSFEFLEGVWHPPAVS